jgi:glycosyltransferase involved in cell wall biosynthesis
VDPNSLRGRLSIFVPPGRLGLGANVFGKDVANLQLWQALARHGGYAHLDVLSVQPPDTRDLAQALFDGQATGTRVGAALLTQSNAPQESGVLMRGTPELYDLAWMRRRRASDRAYSLVGMIHTIAPPAMRQIIADTAVAPMHPWDALICTSPSVRDALQDMFAGWGEHLAERTGGSPPPIPHLPVIPLGVDGQAFTALADRPKARAQIRAELGLAAEDVLVLWVGRLSYFEKAFPQPMFAAVQQAAAASGVRMAFALAGWFPGDNDRELYEAAARAHAPSTPIFFLDGNDREKLGALWAGADVFLSLVDNIQETFGITPLEAMAAGLPVVASDWDGYRSTVREGIEGFLIPTLGGPAGGGLGTRFLESHVTGGLTYQSYVGHVAQHTAVHIGRAAGALARLAASPDLRRRMGAAGRARIAEALDWKVVAPRLHDLTDELAEIRARAPNPPARTPANPVKDDPFRAVAGFATQALTPETFLSPAPGATAEAVRAMGAVALDGAFSALRAPPELCADAFAFLQARGGAPVRDVLLAFPVPQRRALELGLAWMAKYGFVDWLT